MLPMYVYSIIGSHLYIGDWSTSSTVVFNFKGGTPFQKKTKTVAIETSMHAWLYHMHIFTVIMVCRVDEVVSIVNMM